MNQTTPRSRNVLAAGAVGAVTAAAANAVIFGVARATDVSFLYTETDGGPEKAIGLSEIVGLSVISFAIGLVAALLAARWGRPSFRVLQVVGAVIAVGTMYSDIVLDASTASRLLLASMHVVVGVAYVASLQIATTGRTRMASVTPSVQRVAEPATL